MAKTQQQQLLVIYLSICLVVVSLLLKVGSVCSTTIPLDANGHLLQQQQQQQQQQQLIDNNIEQHTYKMDHTKQAPTPLVDDNDENLKENNLNNDLTKTQTIFGHPYDPITVVKRAPGGFVGMRGKKLYEENEDSGAESDNDNLYTFPWNQIQSSDDDINWDQYANFDVRRYKKAPTAFYGVRGKKFAAINGGNSNSDTHRWQDLLQKLEEEHIRDAVIEEFIERMSGTKNDIQNEMAKRAPTGFTGVRGKRPSFNDIDTSMESLTKRGLGSNAFVGVRGKKDVSHQAFKRSPLGAESLPNDGSKRQRFVDFNNKFVAVRGKKNSYDALNGFNNINTRKIYRSPSSDTMSQFYGKRTPNGFVGMRGKRPFTTDDDELFVN